MEGECVHRLEADCEVAVDQEGGRRWLPHRLPVLSLQHHSWSSVKRRNNVALSFCRQPYATLQR
jgi:hypothetical protein